ncbi:esterase-like activity of phytase family protein [Streptomyces sp. ISL-94]|uniref:esterase-like activity of phytase family protein n=1 Tax=Streptomyces sp. ISL-94 TaxID=2819190 RepID=UPI002035BECD|nr:esterase-like activity of phytase family protein [Streptomyces sp. ISL-94]
MKASMILRACATALVWAATLAPAVAAQPGDTTEPSRVGAGARLLGERTVPHKLDFRGTTVGGLSGIDRDPCTGEYALISDDR